MEKTLNSRIINKHDLEVNWLKAINFVPKQGELIVYDIDDKYTYQRFKIGDGVTKVNDLPFIAKPDWNAKEGTAGYIENRTHYDDGFDLTYDGNYENYPHHILEDGIIIVQVSDTPLTKEEVIGATGEGVVNGQQMSQVLDESLIYVDDGGTLIGINEVFFSTTIPIFKGNDEFADPGVYFYHIQNYGMLTRLYKDGLKQLDEKYIPFSIARASDIPVIHTPNWNASEGEEGFIENRTHYVEISDSITFNPNNETWYDIFGTYNVEVSQQYEVIWDGEVYNCTAVIPSNINMVALGNSALYNYGPYKEDTGEPFGMIFDSHSIMITVKDASIPHTFSITGVTQLQEVVHQLDEKFIPSTIARTDDLPVAITLERITEICGIEPVMAFAVNDEGDALVNAGWPDDNGNIQI